MASSDVNQDDEFDEQNFMMSDDELVECGYQRFEDIQLMTITMLTYLNKDLRNERKDDLYTIHYLLPTMKTLTHKSTRSVKKITLIHPGIPYIICNSTYNGDVRGTVKSVPNGKWPNGIMSDMTVHDKFVNFKLSRNNINITGVKTLDMGLKGAKMFVKHINKINYSLKMMNERLEESKTIADEVLKEGFVPKVRKFEDGTLGMKYHPDHVKPHDSDDDELALIRTFFVLCLGDIRRYDYACCKLLWVLRQKALFDDDIEIVSHNASMSKYKFSLGYQVDLAKIFINFLKHRTEFYVDYNPLKNDYVKIEIYDPDNGEGVKPRKHGFNIKMTGEVTYTSGKIQNSKVMYKYFITAIDEMREEIEVIEE